jgi:hypothetical protein
MIFKLRVLDLVGSYEKLHRIKIDEIDYDIFMEQVSKRVPDGFEASRVYYLGMAFSSFYVV